jgi:hypothetical protein
MDESKGGIGLQISPFSKPTESIQTVNTKELRKQTRGCQENQPNRLVLHSFSPNFKK